MKIREVELRDAESLKKLVAQLGSEYEMTTDTIKARIVAFNKPYHKIFVVEQNASILGVMAIACYEQLRLPGKCCHIDTLIVDKDFRGKGIGKMLMEKLENYVKENNSITIELITANRRRISGTHDFYKTLGFKDHDELDYTFFSKFLHPKNNVSANKSDKDQSHKQNKLEYGIEKLKLFGPGPVQRKLKKQSLHLTELTETQNHIKAKL